MIDVLRVVIEVVVASTRRVQTLLYASTPLHSLTVLSLLRILLFALLRSPDLGNRLSLHGGRSFERAQALRRLLSARHTTTQRSHQLVQRLARVLVLQRRRRLQVQSVRRRVPLDEAVVWNVVLQRLLQQHRRLVRPRARHVLDRVPTPHLLLLRSPAAAQHQHGDVEAAHELNALGVPAKGQVEAAQTVARDGVGAAAHRDGAGLEHLDALAHDLRITSVLMSHGLEDVAVGIIRHAIFQGDVHRVVLALIHTNVRDIARSGEVVAVFVERNGHHAICEVEGLFDAVAVVDINVDVHYAGMHSRSVKAAVWEPT